MGDHPAAAVSGVPRFFFEPHAIPRGRIGRSRRVRKRKKSKHLLLEIFDCPYKILGEPENM
ncbi:MAG: hypothetical protein RR893_06620 [Clostridia bacterium]